MNHIAFLALDDLHHIHHIAPVALEFSKQKDWHCVLYVQAHGKPLAEKIATSYPQHRCEIKTLQPSLLRRFKNFYRRHTCRSELVINHHIKHLLAFDVLVSADKDLKKVIQQAHSIEKKPLFVLMPHGAGDRAIPLQEVSNYDFMLISGNKFLNLYQEAGYLTEHNHAVVGYPKFDVIPRDIRPKLFANDKPVVLYNPHYALEVSSWEEWGLKILDFFYQNDAYNLIFAPHCNLFRRKLKATHIPRKYFSASHMIIDFGSEKSVDMTYTQGADIYLGDVSSQVYEFIRIPRLCLFLNPHAMNWQNNPYYTCWNFGIVIDHLEQLQKMLSHPSLPSVPIPSQQHYFKNTFFTELGSASARAASAIMNKFTHACYAP